MSCEEESSVDDIGTQLSGAITSLAEIRERLGLYIHQRLLTKQYEALKASMTTVHDTLTAIQTRLASMVSPLNGPQTPLGPTTGPQTHPPSQPGCGTQGTLVSQDGDLLNRIRTSLGGESVQGQQRGALHTSESGGQYRSGGGLGGVPQSDVGEEERVERCSTLTSGIDSSSDGIYYERANSNGHIDEILRLRTENFRLAEQTRELELELRIAREQNEKILEDSFSTQIVGSSSSCSLDTMQVSGELSRCKEMLKAMKADRQRLKGDNCDLHLQMKQLYCTLGDKEAELRDFIRDYKQRREEYEDAVKKLRCERDRGEGEARELGRRAREAVEQNLTLKSQLALREVRLHALQQELARVQPSRQRGSVTGVKSYASDDSMARLGGGTLGGGGGDGEGWMYQEIPPQYHHPATPPPAQAPPPRTASMSDGQLQGSRERAVTAARYSRNSASRVQRGLSPLSRGIITSFATAVQRSSNLALNSHAIAEIDTPPLHPSASSARLSFLSQDNYSEKLRTIAEAHSIPIGQWRANHVLAWIELDLNMSGHGAACSDNIKSGKVLLGLSDSELDSALRLTSSLHRRKVRLAIEELRDPASIRYPCAAVMDHVWVSREWVQGLGLPQHGPSLEAQLVDGRLLNVLARKDLDKHLGVHKRFHQTSVTLGIQLLRMLDFDKKMLHARRSESVRSSDDLLVWSNQQVVDWATRIDLQEYTPSLQESGVHGAVLVLDATFSADNLASILGIPSSKSYVRRHLATELDNIVRPARAALEAARRSGTSFVRSFSGAAGGKTDCEGAGGSGGGGGGPRGSGSARKLSFRELGAAVQGSLGKAFSRRSNKESTLSGAERDLSISSMDLTHQCDT